TFFGRNFSLICGGGSGPRYYRNSPPDWWALPSRGVCRGSSRMPRSRTFRLPGAALIAVAALTFTSVGVAAEDSSNGDDSTRNPTSKRFHEETPTPGARTVRHWSGQSVNPGDGHTYTYDIVGADPSTGHAATIGVDIIP